MLVLDRSTVHRYVTRAAPARRYLTGSATRKYRFGMRVLDLGFSAMNSMELREIARPHLQGRATRPGTRST